MKSFEEQLLAYAAYHRDERNKWTHFLGVPLVTFSILIPMAWFRFIHSDLPISGATVFYVGVLIYYLRLDRNIAMLQLPVTLILLWLAEIAAAKPFGESLQIFLVTFVGGWIIQLIGHAFEGRRPALADNLMQIFNAPLFITVEILFMFGRRMDLKSKVDAL